MNLLTKLSQQNLKDTITNKL